MKLNHTNYKTEIPNGWSLLTEFSVYHSESKSYDSAKEDWIELDKLEILHYRVLQYYKDFGIFPQVGDIINDENNSSTVHERIIDVKNKTIILCLA